MTPFQSYLESVNRTVRNRRSHRLGREALASLAVAVAVWIAVHYLL